MPAPQTVLLQSGGQDYPFWGHQVSDGEAWHLLDGVELGKGSFVPSPGFPLVLILPVLPPELISSFP